jgi:hypothetical protein
MGDDIGTALTMPPSARPSIPIVTHAIDFSCTIVQMPAGERIALNEALKASYQAAFSPRPSTRSVGGSLEG